MNIKQQHDNKISGNVVESGGYCGGDHLVGFENDSLSVESASISSETVPIYIKNEALKEIDGNDSIDGDMTLTSCNKALCFASQLLSSMNKEEDVPNDISDENEDDLIQEDIDSLIYRALYLARSLIRETYRERALRRYHFKRKRRKFLRDNVRYKKKTRFAKSRPRINGKFVPILTFGYAYDFQLGNSNDGVLDMYVAVITLQPNGKGTKMKFTITYNPVCDEHTEAKWKSRMTKLYFQWIKNAEKLAMKNPVKYELNTDTDVPIGIIRIDDGKMNAFGFDMIGALDNALDIAERDESKAIVICGNKKAFSAGFDLSIMGSKDKKMAAEKATLLTRGGMVVLRTYAFPKPVVLAVTGHALALGAIMLFAGDVRIGPNEIVNSKKTAKIGMNEVAIGMTLPDFAIQLAKARIPVTELTQALGQAKIYSPKAASNMGYLDLLAKTNLYTDVITRALKEARRLGGYVTQPSFAKQKMLERGDLYHKVMKDLEHDLLKATISKL
eukprot:g9455.t1